MAFRSINTTVTAAQPKDVEVGPAPGDTVSQVCFSPKANLLAASSWDNQTRIWEIAANGMATPKAAIQHEAPALCVHWSADGTKVLSGGCDKMGRMMDVSTGQQQVVAGHDAPIRNCRFVEGPGNQQLAVTGSWDKTIKFWDLRSQTPIHTYQLQERCFAMDSSGPLLVIGAADRKLHIFNMTNPAQPFRVMESPLKFQTRSLGCFPANSEVAGFCVGSIEGRCQIQYLEEKPSVQSFSFKCHRSGNDVYALNAISFHPIHGTFSTAGSDGILNFWDKVSKQRLKGFSSVGAPITTTAFNADGSLFAYGLGYDWHKGHAEHRQGSRVAIMLHSVNPQDITPKPTSGVKKR
ncbi:WD40-repeat-containing domain protein [Phlyctochytrium arcticum]|nr:WD40-repeat-containing domain protein [Phlyctochytrium arcticum]